MRSPKFWYNSKTLLGAFIALAACLGNLFLFLLPSDAFHLSSFITLQISGIVGACLVIYRRYKDGKIRF